MITYVPNYYSRFKCIADKCQHTCCKGWEIDVDEDSLQRYKNHPEIMSKIEDGSYVLQGDEERCPFLREDLLCQMIIDHGEAFICNICKDHPRFRNYNDDYIDMGLGLCCEEACNIIIDNDEPFALIPNRPLTEPILTMLQRSINIAKRLNSISAITLSSEERVDFYSEMEKLDSEWGSILEKALKVSDKDASDFMEKHSINFEQICNYYLYRYPVIPSFATEACYCIAKVALVIGGDSITSIKAAARMYSSEVEYSDINMDSVYTVFEEDI